MKEFKPGPAIWKAKDADRPVVVTKQLGPGPDGRDYVGIEGSDVGIPLDELEAVRPSFLGQARSTKPTKPNPFLQFGNQRRG